MFVTGLCRSLRFHNGGRAAWWRPEDLVWSGEAGVSVEGAQRATGSWLILCVYAQPCVTRRTDSATVNRVYADFNNCDPEGRVRLNTAGSLSDLAALELVLSDGMTITIYCDDLEATGVVRQLAEGGWGVEIDWRAADEDTAF